MIVVQPRYPPVDVESVDEIVEAQEDVDDVREAAAGPAMERPPAQLHPLQVTANTGAAVCFVPVDILSEDRSTLEVMFLWVQQCIVITSVVGEMIFLRGEQLERRLVEPPAGLVRGM